MKKDQTKKSKEEPGKNLSEEEKEKIQILSEVAEKLKHPSPKKEDKKPAEKKEEDTSENQEVEEEDLEKDSSSNRQSKTSDLPERVESRRVDLLSEDVDAPVLERIAQEGPRPRFVSQNRSPATTVPEEGGSEGDFGYTQNQEGTNEPKYAGTSTPSTDYVSPRRTPDLESVGRERTPLGEEFSGVTIRPDSRIQQNNSFEKVWQPESFDIEQAGRKNPFEEEFEKEVKYEKRKEYEVK